MSNYSPLNAPIVVIQKNEGCMSGCSRGCATAIIGVIVLAIVGTVIGKCSSTHRAVPPPPSPLTESTGD